MIIDNAGTYTLRYTATDDCGKTTTVDRELAVQDPIYGVYWDGTENPQWTRIGKSALLAEPVSQYSDGNGGWIGGSSPFDNIMPWSGMQIVEDAEAGTLVSIPKFYYKWTRDGDSMQLEISEKPANGFLTSPAHADRGDGVGERDVVYVSRYHCADTNYKSVTGVQPKVSVSRKNFRQNIHALGTDVWQYDFAMYWTIAMLYLVEFADWNSQNRIGNGGYDSTHKNSGYTDTMPYHTGTIADARTTPAPIQYRHIEGLWSGPGTFCDGIYFNGTSVYGINKPSDFSDTANGTLIGTRPTSNGGTRSFNNPTATGYEYALYPSTIGTFQYDKYTCDECSNNSNGVSLFVGNSGTTVEYGLFYLSSVLRETEAYFSIGSRLMKLPNA